MEFENDIYQSRSESFNGALVHPRDIGWITTMRLGGNWIHKPRFTMGSWVQSSIPFAADQRKFVNPVVNYFGGGVSAVILFSRNFGLSQTGFLGSGVFSPRRRNPNVQSTTLGIFNFGQMVFSRDLTFRTGWIVEWDFLSRVDSAYQASALGNGEIKNLVNMTPFLVSLPIVDSWTIDASYVLKWGFAGKSIRGSRFGSLSISKTF
jgi:hypothetical protein